CASMFCPHARSGKLTPASFYCYQSYRESRPPLAAPDRRKGATCKPDTRFISDDTVSSALSVRLGLDIAKDTRPSETERIRREIKTTLGPHTLISRRVPGYSFPNYSTALLVSW